MKLLWVLAAAAGWVAAGAGAGEEDCRLNDLTRTPSDISTPETITSWAVVCLIRSKDELQNTRRNEALARALAPYVSNSRSLSFKFFSEDKFPTSTVKSWEKTFKGIGKVQLVDVRDRGYDWHNGEGKKFGYKWMCKFFTVDMYEYLRNFDYYLRVDSDNIISPTDYNFLEWIERYQVEYAYVIRKFEPHQLTAETLPEFVENYVSKCHVHRQILQPPLNRDYIFNFYNNFHIGKISFFNRPDVRHFLVAANSSQLYSHRWGDSTIQAYSVRIFMHPQCVQQLPNISYHHLSHGSSLVSSDPLKKTLIPQFFPRGNWTDDAELSAKSSAITSKKKPNHGQVKQSEHRNEPNKLPPIRPPRFRSKNADPKISSVNRKYNSDHLKKKLSAII